MIFEEDWAPQPKTIVNKYTRNETINLIGHIRIWLFDYYHIGVLQDMDGPCAVNCIDCNKVTYTAAEFKLPLVDISTDAKAFADLLAGSPKNLGTDPLTFGPLIEQKIAYVALYTWIEDGRTGILRAGSLSVDNLKRSFATRDKPIWYTKGM